ncbi:helix-turn-helix domain-containing protein [Tatumella ptyseos]|uniref:helix-turn-helix domain-containing protein n=1 Tax=Tatumella ptyseos TaxID=82987 RepID=UPI0026EF13D1|nr:helix-turn-helix domain-containing protein [Tatumella ptyseos]WKX26243.1 helix-turn-helix domain-containing protein [Tatumella ptyseos]
MEKLKNDWHSADIIAALRKKGTSLAAVSRNAGLSSSTLANALSRPWPKGELLIAQAVNVHPSEIWPSRYFDPVTEELMDRSQLIRTKRKKKNNDPNMSSSSAS